MVCGIISPVLMLLPSPPNPVLARRVLKQFIYFHIKQFIYFHIKVSLDGQ